MVRPNVFIRRIRTESENRKKGNYAPIITGCREMAVAENAKGFCVNWKGKERVFDVMGKG